MTDWKTGPGLVDILLNSASANHA